MDRILSGSKRALEPGVPLRSERLVGARRCYGARVLLDWGYWAIPSRRLQEEAGCVVMEGGR